MVRGGVFEVLCVVALAVGAWFFFKSRRANAYGAKTADQTEDQILTLVERMTAEHLGLWPQASDEEIAQLVRDDLLNHRVKDPRAFRWATPETVGRLRRNAARALILHAAEAAAVREEEPTKREKKRRKRKPRQLAERNEPRDSSPPVPNVTRVITCPTCEKKNRGDAIRCVHCAHYFARGSVR